MIEFSGLPRGRTHDDAVAKAADILERNPGETCLFELVSWLCESDFSERAHGDTEGHDGFDGDYGDDEDGDFGDDEEEEEDEDDGISLSASVLDFAAGVALSEEELGMEGVSIIHGTPIIERKSVFQAHLARVRSVAEVNAVVRCLVANPRIARATHNIRAYRFTDPSTGALVADNDDDGEDAAGGRLAELLHVMGATDVLVVVSRWFGGVLLGPSRFKFINNVARELVEAQPWYTARGGKGAGSGGGGAGGGGGGGSKGAGAGKAKRR